MFGDGIDRAIERSSDEVSLAQRSIMLDTRELTEMEFATASYYPPSGRLHGLGEHFVKSLRLDRISEKDKDGLILSHYPSA